MCFGVKKRLPTINNIILVAVVLLAAFVLPIVFYTSWAWKVSVLLMAVSIINISGKCADNNRLTDFSNKLIPYSFPVYLLHEYPMTTAMKLIAQRHLPIGINVIVFLVVPFLIISICIMVSYLWKRILPKVFAVFFGGRY